MYAITIDVVWIVNRIYLTLKHTTHDHTLQFTVEHTHSNVRECIHLHSSVLSHGFHKSSDNGFQRRTISFVWVPKRSPYLSHSNSTITCNHTSCTLYTLGTGLTENTAYQQVSVYVCVCVLGGTV
jgi:hypothetical protein